MAPCGDYSDFCNSSGGTGTAYPPPALDNQGCYNFTNTSECGGSYHINHFPGCHHNVAFDDHDTYDDVDFSDWNNDIAWSEWEDITFHEDSAFEDIEGHDEQLPYSWEEQIWEDNPFYNWIAHLEGIWTNDYPHSETLFGDTPYHVDFVNIPAHDDFSQVSFEDWSHHTETLGYNFCDHDDTYF